MSSARNMSAVTNITSVPMEQLSINPLESHTILLHKALCSQIRGSYAFNSIIQNWFGTSGYAEIIFKPVDIYDLQKFLRYSNLRDIPITVVGAGSNILVSDIGLKGILVKLQNSNFHYIKFRQKYNRNIIECGASVVNSKFAHACSKHDISGFEFLATIPGNIGGGIAMNCGAFGSEIFDRLLTVVTMDKNGHVHYIQKEQIKYGYRFSEIGSGKFSDHIIISAFFSGVYSPAFIVKQKITSLVKKKSATQPVHSRTGGSTFCNPLNISAWKLIDKTLMRGYKYNKVQISEKHCNFIINHGKKAEDIHSLIKKISTNVEKKFNIELRLELRKIGIWQKY